MGPSIVPSLKTLRVELQHTQNGVIAWLTLNRPHALNSLSGEMLRELFLLFDEWSHPYSMLGSEASLPEDFPRVIVLQAEGGKAFSSGIDMKAAALGIGGGAWDYRDIRSQQLLSRLIERMRALPQPLVAAVDGVAAGAGLALTLACDLRVATAASSFSAAFVRLGLTGSDMATSFFAPRVAGLGVAAEMLLTGRALGAERAHQLGMVNVVAAGAQELRAAAEAIARDMLACSHKGLQLTKEQLNAASDGMSLRATVTAENSHQILLVNDPVVGKVGKAWLDKIASKSGKPRPRL